MFRKLAILALAAAAAGCSDSSTGPGGITGDIQVDGAGGGDFTTIQQAVAAAAPGAVIHISAGTYDERVTVSKAVTLRGSGSGTVLLASAPSGLPADDSAVLVIRDVSGLIAEDLRFHGGVDTGVLVRDATDITLNGIEASGNLDHGVTIRSSQRVSVNGGSFADNGDNGIRVRDGSSEVVLAGVVSLRNGDNGVHVRDASDVSVTGGELGNNVQSGIRVESSTAVVVSGAEIQGNGEFGIRADSGSLANEATVLQDNNVHDNVQGGLRVD